MIYIVRHGQTDYNVIGRYGGRIDIKLNEEGIRQAVELTKVIDLDKIEDTYSQKHLISENELKILDVCSCTNKIIEINYGNGSYIFFTSLKSDGNIYNCLDIDELIKINDYYNISHKGIYVSVMNIKGNNRIDILKNSYNIVYIFHEEKLENSEIKCIEKILTDFSII